MITNELKDKIQSEVLEVLKPLNYTGCVVLDMGVGKSAVAIKAIKKEGFKNILITSPRTNLKNSWKKELEKWGIFQIDSKYWSIPINSAITLNSSIVIENIQTTYKYTKEQIQQFDFIVADEAHLCITEAYGQLIINARELGIKTLGLTGTPNLDNSAKALFYQTYLPIVYEYYDSIKDGLINKKRYFIYQYELTDEYQVLAGTKKKPFKVGEKTQYDYLSEQLKKGQRAMAMAGSEDWFTDAGLWAWKGEGTPEQKRAAIQYLKAIKYRKSFLWNLTSSADTANKIKNEILINPDNKVLLFSELTAQTDKISNYSVHSNKPEEENKSLMEQFDKGTIRELSAVRTLSLGLNLVNVNWAIVESFNSSSIDTLQKIGRTHRLKTEETANIVIIVPLHTQAEQWFNKFFSAIKEREGDIEVTYINDIDEITV